MRKTAGTFSILRNGSEDPDPYQAVFWIHLIVMWMADPGKVDPDPNNNQKIPIFSLHLLLKR